MATIVSCVQLCGSTDPGENVVADEDGHCEKGMPPVSALIACGSPGPGVQECAGKGLIAGLR